MPSAPQPHGLPGDPGAGGALYRETMERLWIAEWDDMWKYWVSIETKTQILLGIAGVILSVVLTATVDGVDAWLWYDKDLLGLVVASLAASCCLLVVSLWVRAPIEPPFARGIKRMVNEALQAGLAPRLMDELIEEIYPEQERLWLASIASADTKLREKVTWTRRAQGLLIVGMAATAILTIVRIFW